MRVFHTVRQSRVRSHFFNILDGKGKVKVQVHTSGLAQPMYVIATNIGKIPLMPDYYIVGKDEKEYTLKNYKGEITTLPNIPD